MKNIGLIPSTTGKPGGQETGYAVSHYIQKNGNFDIFTNKLLNQGFQFNWKESTIKYEIIEKNQITNEFIQNIQENKKIIEINDNEDQFMWMRNFYDVFIKNLDDNTLLTIYECIK
jgi:hypothetical protein